VKHWLEQAVESPKSAMHSPLYKNVSLLVQGHRELHTIMLKIGVHACASHCHHTRAPAVKSLFI
jgi:hypothetical protein